MEERGRKKKRRTQTANTAIVTFIAAVAIVRSITTDYVPIDLDAAAAWYTEASEKGYAKAQNNLGYLYFIGAVGGAPDYQQAIKWSV